MHLIQSQQNILHILSQKSTFFQVQVYQLQLLSMSQISAEGYLRREEVLGNVCAVFVLCGVITLLIVGVLTSFGGGRFQLNTTAIT